MHRGRSKLSAYWLERSGTVSILLELGLWACGHVFFVVAIFKCLEGADRRLFECQSKERLFQQRGQMEVCWYLSSYIECFPEMTAAVALLLAARNFLHIKLYYSMLAQDAVLVFTSKSFWADWLMKVFIWCWANLVAHCFWISHFVLTYGAKSYISGVRLNRGMETDDWFKLLGYNAPSSDWNRVLSLLLLIVLPSTLFVAFVHSAYDVEMMLLPLSRYFHVAKEREETGTGWKPDATCTLVTMTDTATKALVDDCYEDLVRQSSSPSQLMGNIIERYRSHGEKYEAVLGRLHLPGSLWPASLLASFDVVSISQDCFQAVYIWYTVAASLVCAWLVGKMILFSVQESARMSLAGLSMLVVWVQISIVAFVGYSLATSLCSCCLHPLGTERVSRST